MALGVHRHHRAMARVEVLHGHRLVASLHLNGVDDGLHVDPLAAPLILTGIRGIDALDIEVLGVVGEDCQSPGHALVVTDGHTRKPRYDRSDDVPAGRLEMHQVPKRRVIERTVRIVRQERVAGCGTDTADHPVVAAFVCRLEGGRRARDGGHRPKGRRRGDASQSFRQLVVQQRKVDVWRHANRDRWIGRQQPFGNIGANRRHDPRSEHLRQRIPAHRESFSTTEQVRGLPGLWQVAGHSKFFGRVAARDFDPLIDAAHELFRDPLGIGTVAGPLDLERTAIRHEPRHAIARDEIGAQNLREPAERRAPPEIDLKKPVLSLNEPLRQEQVVLTGCVDVWNAPPVPYHTHRRGEPVETERSRGLREWTGRAHGRNRRRWLVGSTGGAEQRQEQDGDGEKA